MGNKIKILIMIAITSAILNYAFGKYSAMFFLIGILYTLL